MKTIAQSLLPHLVKIGGREYSHDEFKLLLSQTVNDPIIKVVDWEQAYVFTDHSVILRKIGPSRHYIIFDSLEEVYLLSEKYKNNKKKNMRRRYDVVKFKDYINKTKEYLNNNPESYVDQNGFPVIICQK